MAGDQFSSEEEGYNHQKMAYPGGYMHPQGTQGYNADIHMPTPYYSAPPSFQPNGMDMQHYHEPRTSPAPDMQEMQKYIVDMNASLITENARLENMARGTARDVENLRNTLRHDLRILEGRIKSLQDDAADTDDADTDDADTDDAVVDGTTNGVLSALNKLLDREDDELLAMDVSPTQEMLAIFRPEQIAEEYRTRAEIMGRVASELTRHADYIDSNLGRHADKIDGIVDGQKTPSGKLLEALPTPESKVIRFACCETAYGDVNELTAHFKEAHSDAIKPRLASDAGPQTTPTHVPAPRPCGLESSRAVEIKAPISKVHAETGKILGRLMEKNMAHAAHEKAIEKWIPFAVSQMQEQSVQIPDKMVTFSWEFLRGCLEGDEWSSGFYFYRHPGGVKEPSKKQDKQEGKAYWLLNPKHEPYLPEAPGAHGAKLTAFFHESSMKEGYAPRLKHYMDCPVFIKEKDSNEYRYYGNYSRTRCSDKVDYDHLMTRIPDHVRRYWAEQLGSKGRPQWVTEKLMEQFWERPKYDGPIPTDSACQTPATFATGQDSAGGIERHVIGALEDYAKDLKEWKKDAKINVGLLTEGDIYDSFANSDSGVEPSLRLWWEYLEFLEFDTAFYDTLVRMSKNPRFAKASGKSGAKRPATPPVRGTGSTEMKAGALDEKEERKLGAYMSTGPTTSAIRGTHEMGLKAGTIGTNAAQVIKPSLKTGDDVAAAVANLHKRSMQKQAAMDSKLRKSALAPPEAPRAPHSSALAIPKNGGLPALKDWLLDDEDVDDQQSELAKSEVKKDDEHPSTKPLPTWGGGGDLTVAKHLNDELKKAFPGKGKAIPPHLRRK